MPGHKGVSRPPFQSFKVLPQSQRWLLVLCGSQSVLLSDLRPVCHHWSVCVCQHAGHKLLDVHSQHVPGNAERPEQVRGQLAQGAPQCRSPSGPGYAAAEGKANSGCIWVWSQDLEDLLSLFLICTGDNLSKQIGWDVSAHAAQEGGSECAGSAHGNFCKARRMTVFRVFQKQQAGPLSQH